MTMLGIGSELVAGTKRTNGPGMFGIIWFIDPEVNPRDVLAPSDLGMAPSDLGRVDDSGEKRLFDGGRSFTPRSLDDDDGRWSMSPVTVLFLDKLMACVFGTWFDSDVDETGEDPSLDPPSSSPGGLSSSPPPFSSRSIICLEQKRGGREGGREEKNKGELRLTN